MRILSIIFIFLGIILMGGGVGEIKSFILWNEEKNRFKYFFIKGLFYIIIGVIFFVVGIFFFNKINN